MHACGRQDFQRIITDFAGRVALVSDQGLFIQPADDSVELIGASGNISNNIAISPAVSYGDGKSRYIVTTAWDWGPLASWDDGAHWPGWNCKDCEGPGYTHGGIGEGGFTRAFGQSNHVYAAAGLPPDKPPAACSVCACVRALPTNPRLRARCARAYVPCA